MNYENKEHEYNLVTLIDMLILGYSLNFDLTKISYCHFFPLKQENKQKLTQNYKQKYFCKNITITKFISCTKKALHVTRLSVAFALVVNDTSALRHINETMKG